MAAKAPYKRLKNTFHLLKKFKFKPKTRFLDQSILTTLLIRQIV